MYRSFLDGRVRAAVLAVVLSVVLAGGARADMYLDLVAVPGAGYAVLDNGKTVHLDQESVGSVNFQFSVVFPSYQPGDDTGLYQTVGVFLSQQTDGGAMTGGTLAYSNTPPFSFIPARNGRQQDLNSDGVGDVGIIGSGTYGQVWVESGGRYADFVTSDQDPFGPIPAPGNQVVGNLILTISSLHPAPLATSQTEYGFIPRHGAGSHVWRDAGVNTRGIPTVTAPVAIMPYIPPGMWTGRGGAGNARWDVAANWAGGIVPVNAPVAFGASAGNGDTIDLSGDRSATVLTCANTASLTFTNGALSVTGIRKITRSGSVTFSNTVPVHVAGGATIENTAPGGQLALNGDVSLQGADVAFTGTQPIILGGVLNDNGYGVTVNGTLATLSAIRAARLDGSGQTAVQAGARLVAGRVRQGRLSIGSGAAATIIATLTPNVPISTSRLASMSIASSPAPTGTLDLNNNSLIIDYTGAVGSILSDVTAQIRSGRNGVDANDQANWNGPGIITTKGRLENVAAKFDSYNLGAINNADLDTAGISSHYTSFAGQAVTPSTVLVKYTYSGDADLNGIIDGDDYGYWLLDFLNLSDPAIDGWLRGDFNYDGRVDGDDYTQWLNTFLLNGPRLGGADGPAPVPEPATAALFAAAAFGLRVYAARLVPIARRVGQSRRVGQARQGAAPPRR